ncbi:carbonic anhydrase [uncultured Ferrimonas sp.]|uniref:beta-class carbonic anhydrase n=1 Tax=uncultured Ferrimonas sp. TaxID=432640 RepID=UPI0026299E5D|nr:carbonic anhydrase [uncultured Ferrimonas sp.]
MSLIRDQVEIANQHYRDNFGDKSQLAMPPQRRFAILTCMDARLDPAQFAGLVEGDAHVIRNAGGRASDDAIRSLIISHKLLGTCEWLVIHHTDCGMETFDDPTMAKLLRASLDTAHFAGGHWHDDGESGGSNEGAFINWLTINNHDDALVADVSRLRHHPLVPPTIPIYGYLYHVNSGQLTSHAAANNIGRAR